MVTYVVRGPHDEIEPPGPFVVGRTVRIAMQVLDRTDGADEAALDISTRWSLRIRAYVAAATATTRDEVLTESTTHASTGYIDHPFKVGATAYAALRWEIVLVDGNTGDAASKTLQIEYILLSWKAAIVAAPVT